VKQDAVGSGNGTSWADAYTSLQAGLAAAQCGGIIEIWVAAGAYKPTAGADRAATFQLKSGMAIYGGFAGSETSRSQRDWKANPTFLSGDIGTPGDNADNSCHVVTGSGTDASAVLDGFTVTAGNADGGDGGVPWGGGMLSQSGSPALTNVTFADNAAQQGGGALIIYGGAPTFTNVIFRGNAATLFGGGLLNDESTSPLLVNVAFWGNTANLGGGMLNYSSSPTLINVTFAGNAATSAGGGVFNWNGVAPAFTNTILWGNTASTSGPQISNDGSALLISYSDIQGSGGSGAWDPGLGTNGGNNIDANPLFRDAMLGNLRLAPGSPAIDAGSSALVPPGVTTDADGSIRVVGAAVDMGAYEYSAALVGVASDPIHAVPVTIALRSPYPNPSNRGVHVTFDVERRRGVRIGVYDVQGRRVRTLLDEVREPGRHTVRWDRVDDAGRQVARGLYFLRLHSEGWSAQRKLVVVD
jgi:hypothetical protein